MGTITRVKATRGWELAKVGSPVSCRAGTTGVYCSPDQNMSEPPLKAKLSEGQTTAE